MLLYQPRHGPEQNSIHFLAAGQQVDEIIRTVTSTAFRDVTIELVGSAISERELGTLHAYHWADIDEHLSTHPTVRTVTWMWKAGWSDSLMTYLVKRMLPLTSMRRKLVFKPSAEKVSSIFHVSRCSDF